MLKEVPSWMAWDRDALKEQEEALARFQVRTPAPQPSPLCLSMWLLGGVQLVLGLSGWCAINRGKLVCSDASSGMLACGSHHGCFIHRQDWHVKLKFSVPYMQQSRSAIAKPEGAVRVRARSGGKSFTSDFKRAVNNDNFKEAIADTG